VNTILGSSRLKMLCRVYDSNIIGPEAIFLVVCDPPMNEL
jgi:hypothetical protein